LSILGYDDTDTRSYHNCECILVRVDSDDTREEAKIL
jgi:hypothetical protein